MISTGGTPRKLAFQADSQKNVYPLRSFDDADAILMTEKDAVKCAAFASRKHWALRVDAVPDAALGALVLRKLSRGPS